MGATQRCHCCGRYFSADSPYRKRRQQLGHKLKYCSRECAGRSLSRLGIVQASNKKRGKSNGGGRIRTKKDKDWSQAVLKRDNYQCQHCGLKEKLQAHHILPYAKHPDKRLDLSNGITLCATCHSKQHPNLPSYLFHQRYSNVHPSAAVKTKSKARRRSKSKTRSKRKPNKKSAG